MAFAGLIITPRHACAQRGQVIAVGLDIYIWVITRVSVRYGVIFHEPKVSEISRHISQLTSVISALFL